MANELVLVLESIESSRMQCPTCGESILYTLKPKGSEAINMGLSALVACLYYAVRNEQLPPLPEQWIQEVNKQVGVDHVDIKPGGGCCKHVHKRG